MGLAVFPGYLKHLKAYAASLARGKGRGNGVRGEGAGCGRDQRAMDLPERSESSRIESNRGRESAMKKRDDVPGFRQPCRKASAIDQDARRCGLSIPAVRRGKKAIMGWFDPAVGEMLREISYEERVSQQSLLKEALNLMFKKHGKAEIA